MEEQCAWASLHVDKVGWLNATVTVAADKMTLTATLPSDVNLVAAPSVVASAYGWGPIPMLSAYDAGAELPVLPWNKSVSAVAVAAKNTEA